MVEVEKAHKVRGVSAKKVVKKAAKKAPAKKAPAKKAAVKPVKKAAKKAPVKKLKSVDERIIDFKRECNKYFEKYNKDVKFFEQFVAHWTAKNDKDIKMKFEKQKCGNNSPSLNAVREE